MPDSKYYDYSYRFFGLAYDLAFSYPIVIGLICSFWILYYKWSLIKVLVIISSFLIIAFNARIGFLPIVIAILISIAIKRKWKLLFGSFVVLILLCGLFINTEFYDNHKLTILWALDSFFQASDFFFGTNLALTDANHLKTLTGDMIQYPTDFVNWILGEGINAFGSFSDMGYIIHLNYGGLFFCSLLYLTVLIVFYYLFHENSKYKYFNIVLFVTFFLSNIKGDVFSGDVIRFLFFYFMYMKCMKINNVNI